MSRTTDYIIWHENKYGSQPTDFSKANEYLQDQEPESKQAYAVRDLVNQDSKSEIITVSPSVAILLALQEKKINLEDVHWRTFEEIVAELLIGDGYDVTLTRGTKDGGVDILAERIVPRIGPILSVWQAKKQKKGVGIECVRELADTRNEFKASKGVIVTSSYLTNGALKRIERDKYILEGCDKPQLLSWISNYKSKTA